MEIEDFKKLRFKVMEYEDLYESIPEIKIYPEFIELKNTDLDFDKVFRYIAFIHDYNSPLHLEADIKRKKVEAAKLAKFPEDDGVFEKEYMNILQNTGAWQTHINKAIIRYARIQNDHNFVTLASYDEVLLNNHLTLLSADIKEQADIIKNNKGLMVEISNIKSLLLRDNNYNLESELLDEISNYQLELTLEDLIVKEEARNIVLKQGNPYEGYKRQLYTMKDLNNEEFEQYRNEMTNNTKDARKHFKSLEKQHEGEIHIKKCEELFDKIHAKEIKRRKK